MPLGSHSAWGIEAIVQDVHPPTYKRNEYIYFCRPVDWKDYGGKTTGFYIRESECEVLERRNG